MGGGVLTMIGSHVIDVVSAVINQRAVRVHGCTRTGLSQSNPGIRRLTSDKFCSFHMEMEGGALVVITLNSQDGQQNFSTGFTVSGSQGYLTYLSSSSGLSKKMGYRFDLCLILS